MRQLKYSQALSEGIVQAMERDPNIFMTGIAVDYPSGIFGSTVEATRRFPDRVFDSPAMENALTGIAVGAAAIGKRPIVVHPRNDFMFLAFDNLINLAAKWRYMYGGNAGMRRSSCGRSSARAGARVRPTRRACSRRLPTFPA